jgi:hypothetical protein
VLRERERERERESQPRPHSTKRPRSKVTQIDLLAAVDWLEFVIVGNPLHVATRCMPTTTAATPTQVGLSAPPGASGLLAAIEDYYRFVKHL